MCNASEHRQPDPSTPSERLAAAGTRIDGLLRTVLHARLSIGGVLKSVREQGVDDRDVVAFLVGEHGWSRADVNGALRIASAVDEIKPLADLPAITPSLPEVLASAGPVVRQDLMAAILSGKRVTPSDVRRSARSARESGMSKQDLAGTAREKALKRSAARRARDAVAEFRERYRGIAEDLVGVYKDSLKGRETEESRTALAGELDGLSKRARVCMQAFKTVFETETLPPAWQHGSREDLDERVLLAQAWEALRRMARGDYQEVDPQSLNPIERRHPYIDNDVAAPVAWLFGTPFIPLEENDGQSAAPGVRKRNPPKLTSLEICAGGGGMAIGLHAAGFRSAALYERNAGAVATLRDPNNCNGWTVHQADVRDVCFRKYRGHIDLVAGGVPCQPHSSLGNGLGEDDPRDLFGEAVRIVGEVRPRAFFFENVKGFGFGKTAAYRAKLYRLFGALGYGSQIFTWHADDYGLAQRRPRVALVGFLDGAGRHFIPPRPIVPASGKATVGKVLHDLVAENGWPHAAEWRDGNAAVLGPTVVGGADRSGRESFSSNHQAKKWSAVQIDVKGLAEDAPGPDHPAGAEFFFTLRMGARLQGFPDYWSFWSPSEARDRPADGARVRDWWSLHSGSRAKRQQIGNALPPVMAAAVGLSIRAALEQAEFDFAAKLRDLDLPPRGALATRFAQLNPPPWAQPPA